MTEATTVNHGIAEALLPHAVPIDVPELHPTNPRRGNVEVIAESLTRFGQIRPIVLQRSTAYVIAGNHTLRAARSLGWTHIAVVPIDISDEEAEGYLIADNRIPDLGTYDDSVMAPLLEKMMLDGRLTGTGYTPDQVDDMLSAMDALPEVEPEPTEAVHGATGEELEEVYKNRNTGGALRSFVVMYTPEIGAEVERYLTRLARAWGVSGARDVVLEALRRASQDPPVMGLTDEEKARADLSPVETPADVPGWDDDDDDPDDEPPSGPVDPQETRTTGALAPDNPPEGFAISEKPEGTFLERMGLSKGPGADTPPQPATLKEQEQQQHTTPGGKVMTDADFEKLADEAEAGHPDSQLSGPEPGEPA